MPLTTLQVSTRRPAELVEITDRVQQAVRASNISEGTCIVYVPHTTAGLLVNENADPTVAADILSALDQAIPLQGPYRHAEGNSAAHVKASLVGTSHSFIVQSGRLLLGTWQGLFLAEFDGPRQRRVLVAVQ